MVFPHFKNLGNLILIAELDWIWDLVEVWWSLVIHNDLLEMGVESIRNSSVFSLASVFPAEVEDLFGCVIIEVHHFIVRSQGIKDDLACVKEEIGSWLDGLLLFNVLQTGVSKEDHVFW